MKQHAHPAHTANELATEKRCPGMAQKRQTDKRHKIGKPNELTGGTEKPRTSIQSASKFILKNPLN